MSSAFVRGHKGGADRLTQAIATQVELTPILTGASSGLRLPGIDILGQPFGWIKGDWETGRESVQRSLDIETIQVIQDSGSQLWQANLPPRASVYISLQSFDSYRCSR